MEKVVVDASVVVKWFIEEKHSDKALEFRDRYINLEIELLAPELLPYEVLNALRYSKLFTSQEMKNIAQAINLYGFKLYPLIGELAELTIEVAYANNLTIYDASYLALAIKNKTMVYTADKKLAENEYAVDIGEI